MTFEGCFTVLVTPFTKDGTKVDTGALASLVDWQIAEGVPGLVVLGSTGEFLSLEDEERNEVISTTVRQARGRVPVLAGTAAEWTTKACRYSREAQDLGADGLMIVPPFYSSPTEDELVAHFEAISAAIRIPIMLYNNPNTANVDMKPPLIARLSEIENIRYLKDASGEAARVMDIERLSKGRMTVFARYEAFHIGAKGYVSVFGNVLPRLSADMYRLTAAGDIAGGRRIYESIVPLLKFLSGDFYVSGTKAALELTGRPMGPPRAPRLPYPAAQRKLLQDYLTRLLAQPELTS